MKRLFSFMLIIVLITSFSSCSRPETEEKDEDNDVVCDDFCWKSYPGEILPEIMVNGRIYYWEGESKTLFNTNHPDATVYSIGDGKTYLPKDFSEYGKISSVTTEAPANECQLMADFEVSGTVFISEDNPEAVYVLLTAENLDWPKEQYIRFISSELLEGQHIAYGGKFFRIYCGGNPNSEYVFELPENAVSVGNLKYIGMDKLPENDLETNCPNDSFSKALTGKEVFQDPSKPTLIFVKSNYYNSAGTHERYIKCSVIE